MPDFQVADMTVLGADYAKKSYFYGKSVCHENFGICA
jgi:hypothetical protein